jgi:hypothetical protein
MKFLAHSLAAVVLATSLSAARADNSHEGKIILAGSQAQAGSAVKEGRQVAPQSPTAPLTDVDRYLNDRGGDPYK